MLTARVPAVRIRAQRQYTIPFPVLVQSVKSLKVSSRTIRSSSSQLDGWPEAPYHPEREGSMSYEYVLSERDGPVGVVTINRPRQLNALSSGVLAELVDALGAHDADDEVRAIILTGGPTVFAAGADLKEFGTQSVVDMMSGNRVGLFDRVR